MRIESRFLAHTCAALVLALFGSLSAWAQDYTVTTQTGQWVTPPASGTTDILPNISNKDDGIYTITSLPFAIPYFGVNVTSISACTNGYCFMNASGAHATAYSPTSYPYPQTTTGTAGRDGIVAVNWQDLDGRGTGAQMLVWTDGTFPNRRFIISWMNWMHYSLTGSCPGFQLQFYESGRIQMAYMNASSWIGSTAGAAWNYQSGVGIDALTPDTRWVTPNGSSTYYFSTNPPNDWRFEPKLTTFTGTVLMDRYLVDASGIGNTKQLGQPASGLTVELRDATNKPVGTGVTDVNGSFNLKGVALVGTSIGTLWITGQTPFCAVRPTTGGASAGVQIASSVPFNADKDVGTTTIGEAADPGGTNRAALNIASTIQGAYDWCKSRTPKAIPFIEVIYSPSSTTFYSKPGATAAQMGISGASGNPDGWDRSVIRRTYGRHVLGAVSGYPSSAFDNSYDAVTNDENAFAEGFGYYLHFAVSGESSPFYDGLSSSSTNATNVEEPVTPLTSPPGSNVAAWCALALYDCTDAANEPWDLIDGTGSNVDRPFRTVATLTTTPTASSFYTQWASLGFDAGKLSTGFIRHGMLVDDADEPNDTSPTAKALTQFGFIRSTRVLNMFNEDWYSFIMPQPTNRLTVNVTYDRVAFNSTIVSELYDGTGAKIATAAPLSPTGAFQANTGALAAGTFRIRVVHTGGVRLPNYEVSAFSELAFSAADLAPWTVGRPISLPVNIKGGIPPYTLTVEPAAAKPPGLILDGVNARVTGVPSKAGLFNFILSAGDSANPKNFAAGPQSFRVNPPLEFRFGEFVAVPFDRDFVRKGAYLGGTAPYTTTVTAGELPPGVGFADGKIEFVGRATAEGSFPIDLTSVDVAGSDAAAPLTAVVCMPAGTDASLAGGKSACGFFVDGVAGSTVKLGIGTASRQPRRQLSVTVLDADGTTALETKVRGGKGSASVPKLVLPSTGRFYVVVSSDIGEATQLVSTGKVTANRGGKGANPDQNFVAGKQYHVQFGALEGAKLTFNARPDGSGLALKSVYLLDPNGEIVFPDEVTQTRGAIKVVSTLGVSGTWTMIVGAEPGPQGHFKYSYKLEEPKGAAFQAD